MQLLGREIGLDQPFFLIAGPCVVESEELQLRTAEKLKAITEKLGVHFIFKSSFDKANRSSDKSFRGPGMDEGLRVLEKVKNALDVPVLTDVHDIPQIAPVAAVVDVLQTPAFLARQTDFIHAVAASGKPVNIKKAQFMAPHDMVNVVDKARRAAQAAGVNEETIMVCERGEQKKNHTWLGGGVPPWLKNPWPGTGAPPLPAGKQPPGGFLGPPKGA